jgi:small-conductance mechanosensitive channel
MKLIKLLIKLFILLSLAYIRLEEINVEQYFAHFRYKRDIKFYFETFSGILIFLLLADLFQFLLTYIYRRRKKLRGEDNFTIGVSHIYIILVFFTVVSGLFSLLRVDFKEVITSISIVFAGLAILTKDYVSNLINGMILTFSSQLSIGDQVKIGENRGKILDITLSNIHLLNDDDDYITIPNNTVFTSQVVNYSKREIKKTSIEFEIDLDSLDSVENLEADLIETLLPFEEKIRENSYYLRVVEIYHKKILMKFQYILNEPNKDLEREIRRKTIRRLVVLINAREKK